MQKQDVPNGKLNGKEVSITFNVCKIIQDYNIESVIHFAAHALVEESERLPYKYFQENSINSIQFIQTCIQNDVKSFVFSSTCATYGVPAQIPITESTPQNPSIAMV
jgi:UDP-glucose 4-epimerase